MNIRKATENDNRIIGLVYARANEFNEKIVDYLSGLDEYVKFCIRQDYACVIENVL